MVNSTDLTLGAYISAIKTDLWASPTDLCLSTEHLGISVAISVGHAVIVHGYSPSYMAKLKNNHYTLHAMKNTAKKGQVDPKQRGGMHGPWTWESSTASTPVTISSLPPQAVSNVPDDLPDWATPPPGIPDPSHVPERLRLIRATVAPSVRTDIAYLEVTVRSPFQ